MTSMFVCVRQVLDMQMIKRTFLPLTVKHADGVCMCGVCVVVLLCVVCLSSHSTCHNAAYRVEKLRLR